MTRKTDYLDPGFDIRVFASQMALLGFYHNSSLFTSMRQVFKLERVMKGIVMKGIVRERVQVAGYARG